MHAISDKDFKPLPQEWLLEYRAKGIDMTSIKKEANYYWDREVLDWFLKYDLQKFKHENIWYVDWAKLCSRFYQGNVPPFKLQDPRSWFEKKIHNWLNRTQAIASRRLIRYLEAFLKLLGW